MSNTFKTTTWMAKEVLRHFENNNTFSKYVNHSYAKEYMSPNMRPGATIKIPKPARFAVTSGAVASFPDITEEEVSLTIAQYNASFSPTSLEMTTSVSKTDFSDRYLRPMANALSSQVDKDGLALVKTTVWNSEGTPGTVPSALSTFLAAGARAKRGAMPVDDNVSIVVDPGAEASIVDALKGVFHSTSEIEQQYKTGKMGLAIGAKWSMDQNVGSRTCGILSGTPLVNGASQTGASLITDGWTNSQTGIVKAGDIFTVSGVYSLNPVTKLSTGKLQQFVVTADANSGSSTGPCTISISPSIVLTGGATPTLATVSNSPADDSPITVVGTNGLVGMMNVYFHKDAFALACVPMQTYGGLDMCAVESDPETGISVRIIRDYDATNDKLLIRSDVLYGWAATRPEWAARIEG